MGSSIKTNHYCVLMFLFDPCLILDNIYHQCNIFAQTPRACVFLFVKYFSRLKKKPLQVLDMSSSIILDAFICNNYLFQRQIKFRLCIATLVSCQRLLCGLCYLFLSREECLICRLLLFADLPLMTWYITHLWKLWVSSHSSCLQL